MTYTGADLIARGLAEYGVEHVFAIVSIHNMPILDAINRLGRTRIIDVRHEQAGTHAADGYARATGKMGVMIASTGPGTTNTVTGLYEAQYASSPVLVITGQAETAFYGKGLSYVHEAENQLPMLATVTRRVESPRHVRQLADAFARVVADMHTGRRAPGALEIPIDLQYAETVEADFAPLPGAPAGAGRGRARAGGGKDRRGQPPGDRRRRWRDCRGRGRRADRTGGKARCTGDHDRGRQRCHARGSPAEHRQLLRQRGDLSGHRRSGSDPCHRNQVCRGRGWRRRALHPAGGAGAGGCGSEHGRADPPRASRHHRGCGCHPGSAPEGTRRRVRQRCPVQRKCARSPGWRTQGHAGRLGADYARLMDIMREKLPRDGLWCRDSTIAAYNFGNQLFPIYEPRTSINPSSGAIGPGLPFALGGRDRHRQARPFSSTATAASCSTRRSSPPRPSIRYRW